jgi:hypothetical protein
MKYKTRSSRALPRLVIEKSDGSPMKHVGFLQLGSSGKKIEVGSVESREFRLMQCLFSPKNFISAKYEPVIQTHERMFGAIRISADALNKRLANRDSADSEMSAIVQRSMRKLQEGDAGEHLVFSSIEGRVRMEINEI